MLLNPDGAVLLLIDLQERLVPALHGGDGVVERAARLAEVATVLGVPVHATEQNPSGLGHTVPALAGYPQRTVSKTAFSASADPSFATLLPRGGGQLVVAGCEAHVCVLQTVLDLLAERRQVAVVADAVGSRNPADREVALRRMRGHGAEVVTSEMVAFEWLRDARHPNFRDVHKLLK